VESGGKEVGEGRRSSSRGAYCVVFEEPQHRGFQETSHGGGGRRWFLLGFLI